MNWSTVYKKQIHNKGGLLSFILSKEKRSTGALIRRLKNELEPHSRILEIGTGTGAIGALLTSYGFDVTVVDNDREMIEIAKKSFKLFGDPRKVYLMNADKVVENFGKNSFDCVITHGMLEHYSDTEIISHLKLQLEVAPLAVCIVPIKSLSNEYRLRGFGDERYLSTSFWKTLLNENFHIKYVFGFGFKETNIPAFFEILFKINIMEKILAPLSAFNEFWINRR